MLTDLKATIGFKCQACNQNIYKTLSIFDLNSTRSVPLTCSCGHNNGEIRSKNQDNYAIHANCCFCGESHSYYIGKKNFWNKKIVSYACPTTSLVHIAIGHFPQVEEAMLEADKDFEELVSDMAPFGTDELNNSLILDLFEKIKELDEDDELYCTCGNHDLLLDILNDNIVLLCEQCGQMMMIDTKDPQKAEELLHADKLVLQKKED